MQALAYITYEHMYVYTVLYTKYQTFLSYEGQGPGEDVHEIGQPVWMLHCVELADVHHIVLILEYRRYTEIDHPTLYIQCIMGRGRVA